MMSRDQELMRRFLDNALAPDVELSKAERKVLRDAERAEVRRRERAAMSRVSISRRFR